jgi:CheY-like chemotaxis protein
MLRSNDGIRMAGMDGLEATQKIKAREDALVVIMFTLEDSEEVRAATKAAGADDVVAKTLKMPSAVQAVIRRAFPRVTGHESESH